MKRLTYFLGTLLLMSIVAVSCSKDSYEPNVTPTPTPGGGGTVTPPTPSTTISEEIQTGTQFAYDALDVYYLWNKEISSAMNSQLDPSTCEDPIATVKKIRYKDGGGFEASRDEDRWTEIFDDVTPFIESVQGVNTTNGMSVSVGQFTGSSPQSYFFIVNYTYKDSPADKAGIKRGDIIISYNGKDITESNLEDAYYGSTKGTYGIGSWEEDGIHDLNKNIELDAVKMYCDPVIVSKTFDVNGKKVGYLMYDSFDVESADKLIQVAKQFKSEGVKELILDLRYNGGGYVFTEELLASMFAPSSAVQAKELYMQEIYNEVLTKEFSKSDKDFNKTFLSYDHEYGNKGEDGYKKVSTKDANIGLDKIYAIVTGNSASASESLLVGLSPFVNITTIGEQTYGKYCTGYILTTDNVYNNPPSIISKWGAYVMVTTYADRDNKNMARPVGILPNIEESDSPWDGFGLGNENETMLKAALTAAGKSYANTRSLQTRPRVNIKPMHDKNKFARRIMQTPKMEKMK